MRLHSRHRREDGGLEPIYLNAFQSQCRPLRLRALSDLAASAAARAGGPAAGEPGLEAVLEERELVVAGGRGRELRVRLLLSEVAHAAVDTDAQRWVLALSTEDLRKAAAGRAVWLFWLEGDEEEMGRRLQELSDRGAVRADFDLAFELEREPLASGGSATLHLARPRCPGRAASPGATALAAKVFSRQRQAAQVRQEVAMLILAQSPNVVRFHGLFVRHGREVLLTEFCQRGDLFEQVARGGVFGEREALDLIGGVLSALSHVHEAGLVHRDVNPQNVLVTDTGQPLLTDFGIAALTSDALAMQTCCGTPGYTAPEVFLPGSYGQKVDVFSAGALLFFALFAPCPLFEGRSLREVRGRTLECRVAFPQGRETSQRLRELILILLTKEPQDRPTASLAERLLRLMPEDDLEWGVQFSPPASPRKIPRWDSETTAPPTPMTPARCATGASSECSARSCRWGRAKAQPRLRLVHLLLLLPFIAMLPRPFKAESMFSKALRAARCDRDRPAFATGF